VSRAARFTFLAIAAVIAVVAVIVLAGGGDESSSENTAATATPTATGTAAPQEAEPQKTATPKPPPPLLTADKVTDLKVTEGDTVRFRVRSDVDEEVHVHGYNLMKDVSAGKTATMSFKATITGIFEIEFEDSATQIAKLTVEPG
jgi:FtsP/CotA-like multicopper oxidase with cupredoxin domain